MRRYLNILLMSIAMVFVACDKDDESNDDNSRSLIGEKCVWVGTMSVTQDDNSVFTQTDVRVDVVYIDNDYLRMVMNQVKFSENMPIKLDMTIDSVKYILNDGYLEFNGNGIVPQAAGGYFQQYTITNLTGNTNDSKPTFSMMCGKYPLSFEGEILFTD